MLPVHPETGKPLLNRQEFPRLLVRDHAVLGGPAGRLAVGGEPEQGWRGVPLGEEEGLQIRTRVAVLRAQAVLRLRDAPRPPDAVAFAPAAGPDPRDAAQAAPRAPRTSGERWDAALLDRLFPRGEAVERDAAEDLDDRLAWGLWGLENTRDNFSPAFGAGPDTGFAQAILGQRIVQGRQLRRQLRMRVSRLLPGPDAAAGAEPTSDGRGQAVLAAIPEPGFPRAPRKAASDGRSTLYVCGRWEPGRPSLFLKSLLSGETRDIGVNKAFYCGVWYDPGQELLYGQYWRDADGVHPGVDVFDHDGRHVARRPLDAARFHDASYLGSLQGNKSSLFCMDYSCWLLYELAKTDLRVVDVHDFRGVVGLSDFKCDDDGIHFCNTASGLLGFYSPADRRARYATSLPAGIPIKIEHDPNAGKTYVVSVADEVRADVPQRSWLHVFDREFRPQGTVCLGEASVQWLCAVDALRRIVVLDSRDAMRFYPLDAGAPKS